jgi:beta-N-acetylhexosaminidase
MARQNMCAYISGIAGHSLTADERKLFGERQPWGLILFARNCASPEQLAELAAEFRGLVGRKDAPILIDQEGGRVQRMSPATGPWRRYPPPALLGKLHEVCPVHALRAARNVGRLIAQDLRIAGINVNCLPVLDVPQAGSHPIISDRAYARDMGALIALARAHVAGLAAGGVLPVAKHMPGHGRATVDSHHELPRVEANRSDLEKIDLMPFAAFADLPMGMTCHVVFDSYDRDNPATFSRLIIRDVLRKQIGFQGLLLTDDLSMKALSGSYADRTRRAIAAGCDVVLHCNGHLDEMSEVAAAVPLLSGKSLARARAALRQLRKPLSFDEKAALRDLDAVMSRAAVAAVA